MYRLSYYMSCMLTLEILYIFFFTFFLIFLLKTGFRVTTVVNTNLFLFVLSNISVDALI